MVPTTRWNSLPRERKRGLLLPVPARRCFRRRRVEALRRSRRCGGARDVGNAYSSGRAGDTVLLEDLDNGGARKLFPGGVRIAVAKLLQRVLDLRPEVLGHPERLQPGQHLVYIKDRLVLRTGPLVQEWGPHVFFELTHRIESRVAEEFMECDCREHGAQNIMHRLSRLGESCPVVDQLARVLPEDVHPQDSPRRLFKHKLEQPGLEPLDSAADGARVGCDSLPDVLPSVVQRSLLCTTDERHLGVGPDADRVGEGGGEDALRIFAVTRRHPRPWEHVSLVVEDALHGRVRLLDARAGEGGRPEDVPGRVYPFDARLQPLVYGDGSVFVPDDPQRVQPQPVSVGVAASGRE
mmetsp:Transcript_8422/g.20941  ORF Transcript_8422/g.20941 Transcript_8422/m.20941 type:complete len:351 (+) Transcript_8422:66-1118(+)